MTVTVCHNCGTDTTPMWRRINEGDDQLTLCNACGLYYKSKGHHRPTVIVSKKKSLSTSQLIDRLIDSSSNSSHRIDSITIKKENIIECTNCGNINTSIWRKDRQGKVICNACGLYYKKNGKHRIVKPQHPGVLLKVGDETIRFNRIRRRKRSTTSITSITSTMSNSEASESPVTQSPVLQNPVIQSPLPVLKTLLPSNYTLQKTFSIGPIEQYHFDYSTKKKEKASNSSVGLVPISSILN